MNIPSLLAAAVLVVSVAACSSNTTGTGAGAGAGPGTGTGTGTAADTGDGSATCESACTYYLGCKGLDSSYQAQCITGCQQTYSTEQLTYIEQLDCPGAIAYIEGGSPKPKPSPAKDCYGCQSDGSSCVYVAGPYASACDASCC
jgi:hypothetical protein